MDVKALLSTCKMPFFFVLGDILGGLGILVCFFFWLFLVFVAMCKLSLVVVSAGLPSIEALKLLTVVASLVAAALGARPQQSWYTRLVAPRPVGFSWTRDQTHVPCIGR